MAKAGNATKRTNRGATTKAAGPTTSAGIERRVVAFGEQLGRIAGTLQAKAEGWMEREMLNRQIVSVRDGAADLLEQLAGSVTKAPKSKPVAAATPKATQPRSRGAVDAPGKKHRAPMAPDPDASLADSQAAKMRAAQPMAKTSRGRGRG
jgi:hypothetical protein